MFTPEIEIRSSEHGGYLKLQRVSAEEFSVEAGNHHFQGSALVSTFMVGSPAQFFDDMAKHWRGWAGEKEWSDLEHRLSLTDTVDNLGHVSVRIQLQGADYTSRLDITLWLDAGQLSDTARLVSSGKLGLL